MKAFKVFRENNCLNCCPEDAYFKQKGMKSFSDI
jgi:hypothetical protein